MSVDQQPPPDIVLLSVDWRTRVPLRAQLIEDGFDVLATDTWPMMRGHLRPGAKPRLAIVDLQGLENPTEVLDGLRVLMKPGHVLVLTALASATPEQVEHTGFLILRRPVSIEEVVRAARGVN